MTCTSILKENRGEPAALRATDMKRGTAFLLTVGLILLLYGGTGWGQKAMGKEHLELQLTGGRVEKFDFEQKGIEGWKTVGGSWSVEEAKDAPSGKRVLVQRALKNDFNVIVAPGGPYTDVDVSVRFKPISGQVDASGGIVFRFSDGRYYVVRANSLEDNFRLYYYDQKRYQIATASVKPPALGQWHTLRVVAVANLIQAYLNGQLLLDRRDSRFRSGLVGLWTKADSVTAFDDLEIKGHNAK
jgi:3-keto-disaccharide hydrolase